MKKLVKIEVTMNEIWMATKKTISKNKKKYNRKSKHKKKNNHD